MEMPGIDLDFANIMLSLYGVGLRVEQPRGVVVGDDEVVY